MHWSSLLLFIHSVRMINIWMLSFHLKCIIFSALQLKSFQPPYTSVENYPRVTLSDSSGFGLWLARQPISLSRAGSRGWLKMAYPRESQQLAITLTVCLHQSTCICWPSNMMSLLISCISLMGSRGASYPHSRHFLPCCIVGYVRFLSGDQFFKVLVLLLLFFLPLFLISRSFLSAVSPLLVLFALLCRSVSRWKRFHCVCILVMWVLVMISTYLPRYTLNWM